MSVLYFGGSFNPIHHAHLICARAVAEKRQFERIILVPAAQPPHKPRDFELASEADRLEMCRLATAGSGLFETNDLELRRGGPSYTIETVREIKRASSGPIYWLIGADMLLYLPKWRQPLDLLQEVQFVVTARPGFMIRWTQLPPEFRSLEANVVEAPLIDISSSDIRRRVRADLSIDYLTPPAVCDHIRTRGLYR
jgi:nicotinate-nucleotide adenylyltransferase